MIPTFRVFPTHIANRKKKKDRIFNLEVVNSPIPTHPLRRRVLKQDTQQIQDEVFVPGNYNHARSLWREGPP